MRKRILYICKRQQNPNWSNSLNLLASSLDEFFDIERFEVTPADIMRPRRLLKRLNASHDCVLIHHSICFFSVSIALLLCRSQQVIFLAHETEPLLGWRYALRHGMLRSPGFFLRFSKLWAKIPSWCTSATVCLSKLHADFFGQKAKVVHYLSVDESAFTPTESKQGPFALFPADPKRPEKNYGLVKRLGLENEIPYAHGVPNAQMPDLYRSSRLVVIPSHLETYCLAFLEAMACNCYILASSCVGIADDLRRELGSDALAGYGIYVYDNDEDFGTIFGRIRQRVHNDELPPPRTRQLMFESALDRRGVAATLATFVQNHLAA